MSRNSRVSLPQQGSRRVHGPGAGAAVVAGNELEAAWIGLLSLAVAMGIGRFAFTPVLPAMIADAGLSVSGGAWLAAANYGGYLAGALAAIRVHVDSGRAMVASTLAIAVFTAAMALSDSFAAWFAWRALAGIASAFALVHVATWTGARIAQRPALNGVTFAGVGTGIAATGLACLALFAVDASSSQLWLALGSLALVVALVCAWRTRRWGDRAGGPSGDRPGDGPSDANGRIQADAAATGATDTTFAGGTPPMSPPATVRSAWRLIVAYGVSGFGYIVPATFLPVMARATLEPAHFGWVWPLFGFAAALSTWVVARHVPPPRARFAWMAGQLVMAAGVASVALFPSPATLLAAAVCVGGTFVVITMAGFQVARLVAPSAPRRLSAALTSAFATGQIAGPVLVGLVKEADAFTLPLLVAAALLAASTLLLRERRS